MKKLFVIPFLIFSLASAAACSRDDVSAPTVGRKMLVVYFSAQGHTQAVAERIAALTDADIFRIEAAEPYA